jgi:hypothetical protein
MRYYTFWQDNVWSALPEWVQQFEESIQVANAKINKYTPCDWRIYNEAKYSCYTDGYNQGLLEGHHNDWNEAKIILPENCRKTAQGGYTAIEGIRCE